MSEESKTAFPERPLADRLRPQSIADIVGQGHLLGPTGPIGAMIAARRMSSVILWGPAGVGKTTIARLLSKISERNFVQISAVFSSVAELRRIFHQARENGGAVLFVDEIHRFNKAQQDGFLSCMEDGTIQLVGATTENPSFELNSALLSRAQVLVLHRLSFDDLETLLQRAEITLGRTLPLTSEARAALIAQADGDARHLLNGVERIFDLESQQLLGCKELAELTASRAPANDKFGDWHYGMISALHKSVRGSDADSALYWFARILEAGGDPRFIARRLTRMASEDVGLADPEALAASLAAWQAYERLGSPEGELALAQAVIRLALSPKSNAVYKAYKSARESASESGSLPPPNHIMNAPNRLMRKLGRAVEYRYDHDQEEGFSGQDYLPDGVSHTSFYRPVERGFEREMKKRLAYFSRLRIRRSQEGSGC